MLCRLIWGRSIINRFVFRFIFTFVDAVGHVSAAAGAIRFFACPKKVSKKMAFTFFVQKK